MVCMNEPDKALFCALQLCEQCSHAGKESQSCKSDSSMKKSILVRSLNLTTFHRPAGCRTNPTLSPPPHPPDRLEEFATPLHSRQCPSLNRNSWSQGVPRTRGKLNIGFYTRTRTEEYYISAHLSSRFWEIDILWHPKERKEDQVPLQCSVRQC